jgi:hypothetical protein
VADGDEHRLHPGLGPEHPAEDLAVLDELGPIPAEKPRVGVRAGERRLGHPERRPAGHHAEMTGQPEPPRVGDPVPVTDQHVGGHGQPVQRLGQDRHLPEAEQTRHVREIDGGVDDGRLHRVRGGDVDDHGRGHHPVRVRRVRHVKPDDRAREPGESRRQVDALPQSRLQAESTVLITQSS